LHSPSAALFLPLPPTRLRQSCCNMSRPLPLRREGRILSRDQMDLCALENIRMCLAMTVTRGVRESTSFAMASIPCIPCRDGLRTSSSSLTVAQGYLCIGRPTSSIFFVSSIVVIFFSRLPSACSQVPQWHALRLATRLHLFASYVFCEKHRCAPSHV
jgi:hypothetical protein